MNQNKPVDTTIAIFDKLYQVSVSEIHLRSDEHIRTFGTRTTGDHAYDADAINRRITTFLSVNDLMEVYKRGGVIYLAKQEDCSAIFNDISLHVKAWIDYINTPRPNRKKPPINDLIELELFANAIYAQAKYHEREAIRRDIESIASLHRLSSFVKPTVELPSRDTSSLDFLANYPRRN